MAEYNVTFVDEECMWTETARKPTAKMGVSPSEIPALLEKVGVMEVQVVWDIGENKRCRVIYTK